MGMSKLKSSSFIMRYPKRQAIPEVNPNGVILSVKISPEVPSESEPFLRYGTLYLDGQ